MFQSKYKKLDTELEKLHLEAETHTEHSELFLFAQTLAQLPKKDIPQPTRRHAFITALETHPAHSWTSMLRLFMFTISGVLMLAITLTGLAIHNSKPGGGLLYSYKKNAERLRIQFAYSPEQKVNLELSLAQKRLTEAREVINTTQDPHAAAAALTELAQQTENTVASVNEAIQTQKIQANPQVASKLDSLAKDQIALLNTIKPDPATEPATLQALTATQETTKQAATINKIIAATNEETLVQTQSTKNSTIEGTITTINNTTITLDTAEVITNTDTTYKDKAGNKTDAKLVIKDKISVVYTVQDGKKIAKEISVLSVAPTIDTQKKVEPKQVAPIDSKAIEETPAQASFILEDPQPQPVN